LAAGACTAGLTTTGSVAWLLAQVNTITARTPTATRIQVVDETFFTKFLILSIIVSPLKEYLGLLAPTPFFGFINNFMFKDYQFFSNNLQDAARQILEAQEAQAKKENVEPS
jgi:hypothetical protein